MRPEEIVRTIYLGDRGIKKIVLNYFDCTVNVQIDQISRIRSSDGLWNYYSNEDIANGFLTFGGVRSFVIEPPGAVPDDFIWSLPALETMGTVNRAKKRGVRRRFLETPIPAANGQRCGKLLRN